MLKPGGRALLLMQGFRRVDELARRGNGLVLKERRRVGVGGFLCWALTLEKV